MYNQTYPPNYDIESFKTNLAHVSILLFSGMNDALVTSADLKTLQNALPTNSKTVLVDDYNHLDYMWAADVNDKVNGIVKDFLKNLEEETQKSLLNMT